MNEIREQIEQLRIPVAYGPVGAQQERDKAADTMEKLLAFYEEADGIIAESHGVDGWHLNGDIASWGEFEALIAESNAVQTSQCQHIPIQPADTDDVGWGDTIICGKCREVIPADSIQTEYKGADRSKVAPGDQVIPSTGAHTDAAPGAQSSAGERQP